MSHSKRRTHLDDPKSSRPGKLSQGKLNVPEKTPHGSAKTHEKKTPHHPPSAKKEASGQFESVSHSSSNPLENTSQESNQGKLVKIISRRKYGLLRKVTYQPPPPEYVCSGRFVLDFQELCNERQLPSMPRIMLLRPAGARQIVENEVKEKGLQRKVSRRKQLDGANTGGASGKESSKKTTRVSQRKAEGGGDHDNNGSTSCGVQASASGVLAGAPGDNSSGPSSLRGGKYVMDYSKHVIQVKQADPEDDRTVSSIYIRGCKVDSVLMELFYHSWPSLLLLRCLDLTLAGLQGTAFYLLASCLAQCSHLHSLVLDSNPLTHASLSALLGKGSHPWHLSLRFCGIGDLQIHDLADGLGTTLSCVEDPPTSVIHPAEDGLVSLDLSNNDIGDLGATQLAEALKSNRSLLTLNLAHNKVGDVGVTHLARALAWFPLSPDQEKIRRTLDKVDLAEIMEDSDVAASHSDSNQATDTAVAAGATKKDQPTPTPTPTPTPSTSPKSTRKGSIQKQHSSASSKADACSKRASPSSSSTGQNLKQDGGSLKRARRQSKSKSGGGKRKGSLEVPSATKLDQRGRKSTTMAQALGCGEDLAVATLVSRCSDKLRYKPSWYTPEHIAADFLGPHPLLMAGFLRNGMIWLPGNRAVISLNVSGNRVGMAGMQALLETVEEQMLPAPDDRPGLRRLVLHQNPATCPESLWHKLRRKDPWFRCSRVDLKKEWILPCAIPVSLLM